MHWWKLEVCACAMAVGGWRLVLFRESNVVDQNRDAKRDLQSALPAKQPWFQLVLGFLHDSLDGSLNGSLDG